MEYDKDCKHVAGNFQNRGAHLTGLTGSLPILSDITQLIPNNWAKDGRGAYHPEPNAPGFYNVTLQYYLTEHGKNLPPEILNRLNKAQSNSEYGDCLFLVDADSDNPRGTIVVREVSVEDGTSHNVFFYV